MTNFVCKSSNRREEVVVDGRGWLAERVLRVEVLVDADADGVRSHVIQLGTTHAVEVSDELVVVGHVGRLAHQFVSLFPYHRTTATRLSVPRGLNRLGGGYNYDSTSIRRPFDGHSTAYRRSLRSL